MRKIVLLVGLTLAIAANLVILRLDRDEMIQPRAPFLTRAELEREPELARFDRIGADLAESIRCSGIMGRAAWDALPPRRGAVFVIHAYEPALHRGVDGFRQMPEISADAPLLEDLAKAYRTIGAGDLAGLLDAAANHQTVDQDAAVWMTAHCAELAAIKAAFVTGNLNDLLP